MIIVVCHGKEELYMICKKIFYAELLREFREKD